MNTTSNGRYVDPGVSIDASGPSTSSAVSWPAIIAGSLATITASGILLALGSGLGLAVASPFDGDDGISATSIAAAAATWLIIMQWLSAGLGGYLTGRLRNRWTDVQEDEVFFRDTAHGFLAWAVATVVTVAFIASAATSAVSGGAKAIGTVAAGAATGAGYAASEEASSGSMGNPMEYYADMMFRSDKPAATSSTEARMEATRIFVRDIARDEFPAEDKAYLSNVIAANSDLTQTEASARVDEVIAKANTAKTEAAEVAETARKTAATFSIYTSISMLIGAFIASIAAIFGGRHRDEF